MCHNKYTFDTTSSTCIEVVGKIDGCWYYNKSSSGDVQCDLCYTDYIQAFDKKTCTKVTDAMKCGTFCTTCYQTISGTDPGSAGENSQCSLCDNGYISTSTNTIDCVIKTDPDSNLFSFIENCQYMHANSSECYYCEEKYSFEWNSVGSVLTGAAGNNCVSNNGKLNFCWQFSNDKGTGCETCFIGYIMLNEKTCIALSNISYNKIVALVVMLIVLWKVFD